MRMLIVTLSFSVFSNFMLSYFSIILFQTVCSNAFDCGAEQCCRDAQGNAIGTSQEGFFDFILGTDINHVIFQTFVLDIELNGARIECKEFIILRIFSLLREFSSFVGLDWHHPQKSL